MSSPFLRHGDTAAYHRRRSRSRSRHACNVPGMRLHGSAAMLPTTTASAMLGRAYNHLLDAYKLSDEASILNHRSFAAILQAAGEVCRAQQCIDAQAAFASHENLPSVMRGPH